MKNNLLSRFKRTFKDSSVYAVSSILNSGISFLLLPILTTYYDPTEYGTYSIIVSISVIFGGFFILELHHHTQDMFMTIHLENINL